MTTIYLVTCSESYFHNYQPPFDDIIYGFYLDLQAIKFDFQCHGEESWESLENLNFKETQEWLDKSGLKLSIVSAYSYADMQKIDLVNTNDILML